jgi:hypothetical protein
MINTPSGSRGALYGFAPAAHAHSDGHMTSER